MISCSRPPLERRLRPQPEQALKCPRCDSTNTKFCYYNNYSLSQPRYFCRTCRRYWTKGGTLRNVPVGGGCRKNKKLSVKKQLDPVPQNPSIPLNHHGDMSVTDLQLSILGNPRNDNGIMATSPAKYALSLLGNPRSEVGFYGTMKPFDGLCDMGHVGGQSDPNLLMGAQSFNYPFEFSLEEVNGAYGGSFSENGMSEKMGFGYRAGEGMNQVDIKSRVLNLYGGVFPKAEDSSSGVLALDWQEHGLFEPGRPTCGPSVSAYPLV
ncbi:hypothetical protein AMTR_s00058p00210070 [Amborella trichopoda]|uniref:Dof zinc finger protein n=2 Tax=Amborella trichopoda TaxID=13333 RepID=W1PG94_AMBTC|nr:hypothetical protein AMTR_s00058p00210070 [Amborella trichopoda]